METAMIIKSIIALVLTASFAGGAMYYGTQEMPSGNAVAVDETRTEYRPVETVIEPASLDAEEKQTETTRTVTTQTITTEISQETPPADSPAETPDGGRYIDKFIKQDQQPTNIAPERPQLTPPALPNTAPVQAEPFSLPPKEMFALVLAQTELIKSETLRDQAYLDALDYAISLRDFDMAMQAIEKIKQVELRDTARSRLAISLAKFGEPELAFSLIDRVEIPELQDVMRLQVIEAMILPERQ